MLWFGLGVEDFEEELPRICVAACFGLDGCMIAGFGLEDEDSEDDIREFSFSSGNIVNEWIKKNLKWMYYNTF